MRYFGEQKSEVCGICDVCLARNKKELTATSHDQYTHKIAQLLRSQPLALDAIVSSFSAEHEEHLLLSISFLMDEGFIEKLADGKLVWVK